MKIGIDIDDTLTNTREIISKKWLEYILKRPNDNYNKNLPQNINEFGDPYINDFWDEYREELSFNSSYKMDAATTIEKLKNDNHQLCIITSRPEEKYTNLNQRILNELKKNNIQITEIYTGIIDKGLFCLENNIDILIDDSIKHCQRTISLGKNAILFNDDKSYKGFQTTNWNKIYDYINNIKNRK